MATRVDRMRERLPSLYRPEPEDVGLLPRVLGAVARELDAINDDASRILQAHWSGYADRRRHSPWFGRSRELRGLAAQKAADLVDLVDPAAVVGSLEAHETVFGSHVRGRLSEDVRASIDAVTGDVPPEVQRQLVDALTGLVKGPSLFDAAAFADLTLSDEIMRLIDSDPLGNDLVRLNVLLLGAGFPGEVLPADHDSPYLNDLGHLGALLAIAPWTEPSSSREHVEDYRTRIDRVVRLYRNGLGTVPALRSIVEAMLPLEGERPEQRDHPFLVEEFAPGVRTVFSVPARGDPRDMVGPLMRWTVANEGLRPVAPTLYVQGISDGVTLDATTGPLIELYATPTGTARIGVGYRGTTQPTRRSDCDRRSRAGWVRTEHFDVPRRCRTRSIPANPTAPGPWTDVPDGPTGRVVAMCTTLDGRLWVATNAGGTGTLWHFDGTAWVLAADGLPELRCLLADGRHALAGCADGLRRIAVSPEDGSAAPESVGALAGTGVHVLHRAGDGTLWAGSSTGAVVLVPSDPPALFDTQISTLQGVEVFAMTDDASGALYFGCDLGVVQYQPVADAWFYYEGKEVSEQSSEWRPLEGTLPDASSIFLPPVRAVLRGPDASLWLGTDDGIARYVAHAETGLVYRTQLEAFPDLVPGPVHAIRQDERGVVWFATEHGPFRFDGRDLWQYQGDKWIQLGAAASEYPAVGDPTPRGIWRYERGAGWQRFDEDAKEFRPAPRVPRSSSAQPEVFTIAWTDGVVAELGAWDGTTFSPSDAVPASDLVSRFKPDEQHLMNGGIPAVPRMPVGESTWRYLGLDELHPQGLEELDPPEQARHLPFRTQEGRLIPPPALEAPGEGRFDVQRPPPESDFDAAVFAYDPAARVWFEWQPHLPLVVRVRLGRPSGGEAIDPAILDRVWQGIQQVRPAGVRVSLAVEEQIVRSGDG